MKINRLQNNEVTEIAASVLALALVLPVISGVVYGFETGWDALGFSAVGVLALLMAVYYLILRVMLRYRQKFTETFHHREANIRLRRSTNRLRSNPIERIRATSTALH